MASAYYKLSDLYAISKIDTIIPLCEKAKIIAENNLKSNPSKTIKKSLLTTLAGALNNIGGVYSSQGDVPKALDYYHKSLKIKEEIGDKKGIATSYNNLGSVHSNQGDLSQALEYYQKSLKIREEIGDKNGMAFSYNNIGVVYYNKGDIRKALEYFHKSLEIRNETGDKHGLATCYNNIGVVYRNQGDPAVNSSKEASIQAGRIKAIDYCNKSLKIRKEIGDKIGMATSHNNIGSLYIELGDLAAAETQFKKGLELAREVGSPKWISSNSRDLSQVFKQNDRYQEAFEMFELHIQMRDSINNEATQKAAAKQQAKYEYEKQKALDDAEHEKQLAIEQEAKGKQQILTYATAGGLALVGLFLIYVFSRLKVTRKQKGIIEDAHHELGEKNQEIIDSINYAKRIQSAILPSKKAVKEYLKEAFILYKPKDVVAGDFYWMEQKDDKVFFAAADCTGHGVPGAMVSVVCNNALNRSVREHALTDPGEILTKTREIVVQEFEKSEEEVKDGMDIALCALEKNNLQYAGAHNPLWIIRNGEIIEVKANKQPIGQFDNPEPFTTHNFELQKGDSIYIFSDGYVDQFGGEKGKKFKAKAFRELLLSIQEKSMEEQKTIIDEAFEAWRGHLEQIDDVCIIGVRI